MQKETWQALEDLFSEAPILKSTPVEPHEVATAERELGIPLPASFKEFICRYGGAIVGPYRIYGLRKAAAMGSGEGSFIEMTKAFRSQRWPGVEKWIIVSMDHAGNPVGLDREGKVWISDHDARAVQMIAPDFEAYVRKHCLKLPS